jgi:tRNA(Arg) A34 adenosine deaminase TadA
MHASWILLPSGEILVVRAEGERKAGDPSTIQRLIESVYETESHGEDSQARAILRHRIFSTETPSISDQELVKSAAKRLSAPEPLPSSASGFTALTPARPLPDFSSIASAEDPTLTRGTVLDREELRAKLGKLASHGEARGNRWESDRAVSAILVDRENRILEIAWNTNATIRNRHAEWNLCESLRARGESIPPGATLYVSLKPCRMCAARIWETCEVPRAFDVVYLENDPGRLAQGTLLDTGSPARVRYFGRNAPEFGWEIQRAFAEP